MVRISGGKVRSLREEQNLTQLYLATGVGVTTETISRWERQEAPTVKKENGLKLAEALNVSLDEILAPLEEEELPGAPVPVPLKGWWPKRYWLVTLLFCGALFFFMLFRQHSGQVHLSAERIMPPHTVAGHHFPVVIDVDFVSEKNSSFLLKEQLPTGCRVVQAVPETTAEGDGALKWVDKNGTGRRDFSYMAACDSGLGEEGRALKFEAFLLAREFSRNEIPVTGVSRLQLADFHWADGDRNGQIDDEELLAVYDDFGRVTGLGVDVDEVENIWMGSGYRWDRENRRFEITP